MVLQQGKAGENRKMEKRNSLTTPAERFRLIAEISPDGLTIIEHDHVVFVNDRICQITGCSKDELESLSTLDLAVPEEKARLSGFVRSIRSKPIGPEQLDFWIQAKDGEKRYIRNRYSPIRRGDRTSGYFVLTTDLTERKRAQEALRESERRYRTLFESANDAIFLMDGERFVDCNEMTLKMFECTRDQIIGQPPYRYSPPMQPDGRDSLEKAREKIGKAFSGEPQFFEWRHCRYDNSPFDAEVSLNRLDLSGKRYLLAIVRDITARKMAEDKLRASMTRFQDLTNLLPACVCELDTEGSFTYVNQHGYSYTGYAPEDLKRGVSVIDLVVSEDRERIARNFKRSLRGEKTGGEEYRVLKKDGSIGEVIVYSNPIKRNGEIVGLRGVVIDITEKKRLQEFASRAQRLETAGRIAGQVSHDFNNLLGPLMAYPDLISRQLPEKHPVQKYLDDMGIAAAKMSEINQQLLTLGRRGHYNQSPLNMNDVVHHVLKQLRLIPDSLRIDMNLEQDLMNINGGEAQLFRVVSNLVSNARDAMQDAGLLTIRSENVYVEESFGCLEKIPKGEYVRLTIGDTGYGISPAHLPIIFDPFFTTKKADRKRGSGLGLSIVHAVMEDHAGHIDCDSVVGGGTRFFLYFPATRDAVQTTPEAAVVGGQESVLVIDDDEVQREVCRNLLESLGYQAATAESGEEALELLRHETFDLLVLDMIMPGGIDGAEAYRRALEICPGQRAIVVSGYADSERIKVAQELGAETFVRKPLTLKSLAYAVRGELDRPKSPARSCY